MCFYECFPHKNTLAVYNGCSYQSLHSCTFSRLKEKVNSNLPGLLGCCLNLSKTDKFTIYTPENRKLRSDQYNFYDTVNLQSIIFGKSFQYINLLGIFMDAINSTSSKKVFVHL